MNVTGDSKGPAGRPAQTPRPSRQAKRPSRRWRSTLLAGVGLALGVHALGLTLLAWSWQRGRALVSVSGTSGAMEETPAVVDLTSADDLLAASAATPVPPPALAPQPDLAGLPQDTAAFGELVSRQRGDVPGHRAPRADRGVDEGKQHAPAFRPDRSTLHERLSDGAGVDQLPSTANGNRASSPQALRREPRTGEGDSPTTLNPAGVAPRAVAAVPRSASAGDAPDEERAGPPEGEARPGAPASVATRAIAAGEGPLAADRGARAFDVEADGPARELESRRAASTELHPGRLDLTLASAPGGGDPGRGPGATPGESPQPSRGSSLNTQGGREGGGFADGDAARERQYLRYHQEIARRVAQALVFPRKLALRLEQGETIVRFSVLPSGRIGGTVDLQKSSGFEEFDQAARRAVEKGAPFPPLPPALGTGALVVSLRVPFENPMVR